MPFKIVDSNWPMTGYSISREGLVDSRDLWRRIFVALTESEAESSNALYISSFALVKGTFQGASKGT